MENGGEVLKVRDLLHAVGKKAGIDPDIINNLDLENIVERTVAINEGRELPPDTNEEVDIPKEPEPSPDEKPQDDSDKDIERQPLIRKSTSIKSSDLKRPIVRTISNSLDRTPSFEMPPPKPTPFDLCNFIAIDVDLPDEQHQVAERDLDFHESVVVSQTMEEIVKAQFIAPTKVEKSTPIVILQDTENKQTRRDEDDEPKKFLEKKQKYGRDAKKLHATYQEEWDRLERLGNKKRAGSRRRSVLTSDREDSSSASSSRVQSPVRDHQAKSLNSPKKSHRVSTPNLKVDSPKTPIMARANSPKPGSPMVVRNSTLGAVKAAKEALERRASQNLNGSPLPSPLPSKRFM